MLMTREADYAIRCILEVARAGRISAAQVARAQGISPTFLGKIVQSLARAGILATRRGVGGGVALAVPIEHLTVLQVIEAVEGPLVLNECLLDPAQCERLASCPAYPVLCVAQQRLRDALDVTFAQVLHPGTDGDPPLVSLPAGNGAAPSAELRASLRGDPR
jgi:Rrf2 family protein